MAVGNQPDEQAVHEMMLSDNDAANLLPQRRHPRRGVPDFFVDGLDVRIGAGGRRRLSGNRCRRWHGVQGWLVAEFVEGSVIRGRGWHCSDV